MMSQLAEWGAVRDLRPYPNRVLPALIALIGFWIWYRKRQM